MRHELIVPVVLAGGEGRRLRPLTTPARPKPFLKIARDFSLLQLTLLRVQGMGAPVIVCNEKFAPEAFGEAQRVGMEPLAVIAEPAQRSTAAAIASAAFFLQQENPLMLVMPSDHVIDDVPTFRETVKQAAGLAGEGPVLLGKKPSSANNRYGYIQTHEEGGMFLLQGFIEKPQPKQARKLFVAQGVFWNTGIFICRARVLLKLMAVHAPEIFECAGGAMKSAHIDGKFVRPDAARYARIPAIAIDHAVMEKLQGGIVLPLGSGWHDVGCWERLLAVKLKGIALQAIRGGEVRQGNFITSKFRSGA